MKNFDELYTQAPNGDLVPTPHLAGAIARQYQRLGLSVPDGLASSTPERGRAFDAAPTPRPKKSLVDLLIALREFRDRRAARAMDASAPPRRTDYSGLQRAYDSRRGVAVGDVSLESPATPAVEARDERLKSFKREQFRAAHCMYFDSDSQIDRYSALQRHYDAQRG